MLLKDLIRLRLRSMQTAFLILSPVMLVSAIIGCVAQFTSESSSVFVVILSFIASGLSNLCFSGCTFAGGLMIAYFSFEMYGSDMSYLYFTLPIKRKDIFKAGIRTNIIATLIFGFVTAVCFIILQFPNSLLISNSEDGTASDTSALPDEYFVPMTILAIVLIILIILVAITSVLMNAYSVNTCSLIGCTKSKKHKLLGSIISYFVFNFIIGFVNSIVVSVGGLIILGSYLANVMFAFLGATSEELAVGGMNVLVSMNLIFLGVLITNTVAIIICNSIGKHYAEKKIDIT